jgi:hypothetical protein
VFDPGSRSWTPVAPMADARTGHRAVVLADHTVLVVGGALPTGDGEAALAYCERYDPAAGTWTPTGSLATPRKGHEAVALPDGRVLVTGGDAVVAGHRQGDGGYDPHSLATAELYDPTAGTWAPAAPLPGGRTRHRAVVLRPTPEHTLVLVLGGTGEPDRTAGFRHVTAYDPAADRWTTRAGLRTGRSSFAVVALADGRVLVAGGTAGGPVPPNPATLAPTAEALIP